MFCKRMHHHQPRGTGLSISVVPKLGGMAPQGAMGLLPGSHGRILKKYICQGLILKNGLFEFLEIFNSAVTII